MTTPSHEGDQTLPRAPMGPFTGDDRLLPETRPMPRVRPGARAEAAAGSSPTDSQAAALTQPEHPAVRNARVARGEARAAQESAQEAAADAHVAADAAARQPTRWPVVERSRTIVRENRRTVGIVAGVATAAAVALCCAAGIFAYDRGFFNRSVGVTVTTGTPTTGAASGEKDPYACSPATASQPSFNGATIDTTGKGGAIVDDTVNGHPTEVAVIPANTKVTVSGDVQYWMFNSDCTAGQILGQAQLHAQKAGDQFVSDYHQLDGIASTGAASEAALAIPTTDARIVANVSARIAQRREARLQAARPLLRKVFAV